MTKSENVSTYKNILKSMRGWKGSDGEIEELIAVMKSFGYRWDEESQKFRNREINHSIGAHDLDLFTARSFKKYHKIICSGWKNSSILIRKMDKMEE